jgi:hypothetical protein
MQKCINGLGSIRWSTWLHINCPFDERPSLNQLHSEHHLHLSACLKLIGPVHLSPFRIYPLPLSREHELLLVGPDFTDGILTLRHDPETSRPTVPEFINNLHTGSLPSRVGCIGRLQVPSNRVQLRNTDFVGFRGDATIPQDQNSSNGLTAAKIDCWQRRGI